MYKGRLQKITGLLQFVVEALIETDASSFLQVLCVEIEWQLRNVISRSLHVNVSQSKIRYLMTTFLDVFHSHAMRQTIFLTKDHLRCSLGRFLKRPLVFSLYALKFGTIAYTIFCYFLLHSLVLFVWCCFSCASHGDPIQVFFKTTHLKLALRTRKYTYDELRFNTAQRLNTLGIKGVWARHTWTGSCRSPTFKETKCNCVCSRSPLFSQYLCNCQPLLST